MPDPTSPSRTPFDHWCADSLPDHATLRRSSRSGGEVASFPERDFLAADLLSVQFADGSVLHTSPQQWLAHVDLQPAPAARGGDAEGAGDGENRIHLPFEMPQHLGATRGDSGGVAIEQYRLARLTPGTTLDTLYQVGAWLADGVDRWFGSRQAPKAGMLAGQICRAFESSVLHDALGDGDGLLLHWNGSAWVPLPDQPLAGDGPVLLFLHGTASSTQGSFGALSHVAGGKLPADFAALAASHRLLAWEHRSLTCSPVANALGLAQALARVLTTNGTALHLVSHSRGGMVGDLLCAGLQRDATALQRYADLLAGFYPEADDHPDQPLIAPLAQALAGLAHLQAGTFVRVACPARGTLLADRRTDLFLSLLLRSAGLAFGVNGNPWYERLNGLVRGLVAAKADAHAIPGLEAMVPGSPLTLALNTRALPSDDTPVPTLPGKLRVIAGDSAAAGLGGVFTVAGDVFYGLHDHDFVVHTHSMFGGFVRSDARSLRLEDKSVHHLGYFKPDALARGPLFAVLDGRDDAFRSLADDEAATRGLLQLFKSDPLSQRPRSAWDARIAQSARAKLPIVVVLPGIMGSELFRGDKSVWLSTGAMVGGRMVHLAPATPLDAPSVMAVAYERLLVAADKRYRVLPWPYDWRQPILATGLELRRQLAALQAAQPGVPIHLLAHSMGGLVARVALFGPDQADAFADQPAAPVTELAGRALWDKLKTRGGRLLMLGTPNTGSYAPVQLLAQQHSLSHLLASLARKVSPEDLARWGGQYGGLMQMLPRDADKAYGDLCDPATWAALRADDSLVQLPDAATLRQARRFRAWRDAQFETLQDEAQVFYVAGCGDTPAALRKPGRTAVAQGEGASGPGASAVRFVLSPDGDGVVPWLSRLKPERTWYADCEHGDLADETDAFAGYFELLDSGRTRALPQTPPLRPSATRTAAGSVEAPAEQLLAVPALPSLPADLGGYVLGMRRSLPHAPTALPIAVRIVHGGLDYARFPLIVGHYQNDSIMGGTQRVDQKLAGQLSRMVELKLFTGADRTSVYLRPPADDGQPPAYPGAIVVGLGAMGDLSPAALSATVTRAVLRFAFDHLHRDPWVVPQGPVPLRLSALLIGTHVQAVTPRDSLAAVLGGIWRANQHLLRGGAGRPMQVAEVEVIELHEQTALDAAYELRRLLNRTEWRERLVWPDGTLEARTGRISGYRPSHGDTVWQRLVVRQQALGGMRFELIAERARVEATQVQADVASLASFIQQMSDSGVQASAGDDNLALGQVLYQLLLPLSLKSRLLNLDDTVLVLDEATAAYPWELMVPPEDDSSLGDGPTPLALQAGMVRQRVASDFRALPTITAGHEALVVGAPATGGWVDENGKALNFSPLPGAKAEAEQVGRWLADDHRPWRITALLGEAAPFQRVRMALLARPYRLLHLSGHGVVDFWVGRTGDPAAPQALRKTGMLLNNQQVLTAADIEQMGTVPEFVFINCCYSGREGDETRLPAAQRALPLLASSLALQFIKMGSRAVVAAGWQVDDQAGLVFAQALYAGLLDDNRPFGEAVRLARVAVHQAHPGGNTWGAYQCYGDPDWRLADTRSQRGFAQQYGSGRLHGAASAMSRDELADRVLQMVALAGDKPRAALLMQLDDLEQTLSADPARQAWLEHSTLRSAFGQAYRELGDHASAVRWLQRGVRNAYSRVTLRDVELMVNSLSRLGTPRSLDIAEQILDRLEATDDNELLYDATDHAPGDSSARSERECLRGSNRMHRALQVGGDAASQPAPALSAAQRKQRAQQYRLACAHFTTGYAGKLKPRDKADRRAYALSNAVLCGALALLYRAPRLAVLAHVEQLRQALGDQMGWEEHAAGLIDEIETQGLSTSFWHYTNTLELITARALLRVAICVSLPADRSTLGEVELGWLAEDNNKAEAVRAELAQARRLMRQALVRWPSPVEAESIRSRFEAVRQACLMAVTAAAADYQPQLQALAAHATEAVEQLRSDATVPR